MQTSRLAKAVVNASPRNGHGYKVDAAKASHAWSYNGSRHIRLPKVQPMRSVLGSSPSPSFRSVNFLERSQRWKPNKQ